MRKPKPITAGTRFGRWTILQELYPREWPSGRRARMFRCRCDCGIEKAVKLKSLRSGSSASCGCLWRENSSKRVARSNTTHGQTGTRAYRTWWNMLRRCNCPTVHNYYRYGGRGIRVCERWHKFENFLADMGQPAEKMTLDRIDNDGNYEPGNCAWKSNVEQSDNRSTTIFITCFGKTLSLRQWSVERNIPARVIRGRIESKWTIARALTQPLAARYCKTSAPG